MVKTFYYNKTSPIVRLWVSEYIYVICRSGGPYWEKLCPRSLGNVRPRAGSRAVLKTEGTFFPNTDRHRPANNVFIFFSLENYFIIKICVDFLQKHFHTVRVRLTFRSSKPVLFTEVFKRRDSVFAEFRTEQWRIYISCRFSELQKAAKIAAILENSERSVRGVRLGKSGPLERAELANQIQGFGIPDRWDASVKNK